MKNSLFLIILLFSKLLFANDLNKQDEVDQKIKPKNEKINLLNDYRITQPIKGAITWGSVGLMVGFLIDAQPYFEHGDFGPQYSSKMLTIGIGSGTVIGLYKGFKAQNKRKVDPNYRTPKNKYGYEIVIGTGSHEEYSTYPGQQFGFGVVGNYEYKLIDEFKFRALYKEWADVLTIEYPTEIKYDVLALDYFRKDKIFSPYYGGGIGLSDGELQIYNYSDDSLEIETGFYPFMHILAGVRMNLFDLVYCNLEFDYELSSFYYEVTKHYSYSQKQNFMTTIIFGAKIF